LPTPGSKINDSAFGAVGSSFNTLIDTANDSYEEAEVALKKARGEKLSDDEKKYLQKDLAANLDKLQHAAEHIIHTVTMIKKSQRINKA
jgi:hypothetical protein